MEELAILKAELRSLVISSPTPMNVSRLVRDYRVLVQEQLPLAKYGCCDAVTFLKDKFSDCFIFEGSPNNPWLTPIVPDTLKHIDKMISKQRLSAKDKFIGRRRSVLQPNGSKTPNNTHISTHNSTTRQLPSTQTNNTPRQMPLTQTNNNNTTRQVPSTQTNNTPRQMPLTQTNNNNTTRQVPSTQTNIPNNNNTTQQMPLTQTNNNNTPRQMPSTQTTNNTTPKNNGHNTLTHNNVSYNNTRPTHNCNGYSPIMAHKQRTELCKQNDDPEHHHRSRGLSDDLQDRIRELLDEHPAGVWCVDLMSLYKAKYGGALRYQSAGHSSVISLVRGMSRDVIIVRPEPTGDWRLHSRAHPPTLRVQAPPAAAVDECPPIAADEAAVEDALPGLPYESGVFPPECVQLGQKLSAVSVEELRPGAQLKVILSEMYSPSHVWLLRIGAEYNEALDEMTLSMNAHYEGGSATRLSPGATRRGHLCAKKYGQYWHRALIVCVLDDAHVKVRHVDYGTVEAARADELMALLAKWTTLPAQAVRARLADVRPAAGGQVWPTAATEDVLGMAANRILNARVVRKDDTDGALHVHLSTDCEHVNSRLVSLGHAVPEGGPPHAQSTKTYHYPTFAALEEALTLSYSDICDLQRNGISPEYMDKYTKYMPPKERPAARLSVGCVRVPICDVHQFLHLSESDASSANAFMKERLLAALGPP